MSQSSQSETKGDDLRTTIQKSLDNHRRLMEEIERLETAIDAIAVARRRGRPQNPQTIIPPADVVDTAVLMDLKVNARFIHTRLTTDYETTRDWLARHRLLANSVTRPGCQQPMRLTKKAELVLDGEHVS
uniref:Uncharacterized protein n=1 Tax=Plectus sambesii TaxID=2011161 RepID=A0A914WYW6_9BILA